MSVRFHNGSCLPAHLSPTTIPAANSAEARNSALQKAQSERNVIGLPRGSSTLMQFRKGAAYWSPSATPFAERRS